MGCNSPAEAKRLGRGVRGFDNRVWLERRWDVVVAGNIAKFSQHPELTAVLQATDGTLLVEASPTDRIWGIGLPADHPNALRPDRWQGLNLLGYALTHVRQQLKTSAD